MFFTSAVLGSRRTKRDTTSQNTVAWPTIPAPAGSASLSGNNAPTWSADANADGYLIYLSTSSQQYADYTLYSYRYDAPGQATATRAITGIAAGTYYYRVAAYEDGVIGDLSFEMQVTAS